MDKDKSQRLREGVHKAYSKAAREPEDKHPFPVGGKFARNVGYPEDLLAGLPSCCAEAFAGVSNVSLFAHIPEGSTVLDVGCGAGLDSLVAARKVGKRGKVVGVDFSADMLSRAHHAATEAGYENVILCRADVENLPVKNESIDVALVNGIVNLNPAREAIFGELARVVKRGGSVFAAEIILKEPLPDDIQYSDSEWFA